MTDLIPALERTATVLSSGAISSVTWAFERDCPSFLNTSIETSLPRPGPPNRAESRAACERTCWVFCAGLAPCGSAFRVRLPF